MISVKHAATEVSRPDLVTSDTAIIHRVEPLVSWLFNAVFQAVNALLLGQVQSVLHLLVERTAKRRGWLESLSLRSLTLGSQVMLGQIRLRSHHLGVFFLCDTWVAPRHFVQSWHFSPHTSATPQGVAMAQSIVRRLRIGTITSTDSTPLVTLFASNVHSVHVFRHCIPVKRLHSVLFRSELGRLCLAESSCRIWVNEDIIVGMWCLYTGTTDVSALLIKFLLTAVDVTPVVHIYEAGRSGTLLLILLCRGVAPNTHQIIHVLVCADHLAG